MIIRYILSIGAAIAGLAMMPQASIAQASTVTLVGDAKIVKTTALENGETRTELVAPTSALPGDRVRFSTAYANTGAEPVQGVVLTNPLPQAVRLADDADADLTVSVDGGAAWGRLADLTVRQDDGTTRPASHADVTHVRWTLASVAPGERGERAYFAIIR